jgi:long-chain acyl-CoA synthetase
MEANAKTFVQKMVLRAAIANKLQNLRESAVYTHALWDKLIFGKIKNEVFGGRLRFAMTASAPISVEVLEFLRIAFCAPLLEAYGQTENTGGVLATFYKDPTVGHVGGV